MRLSKDVIAARQRWVKDHPARSVDELALRGYVFDLEERGGIVRTVLSIDLFAQPLAWRAQIALLSPSRQPRPRSSWSLGENVLALDLARQMLAHVGLPAEQFLNTDALSFELCYPCTTAEAYYVVRASLRPATRFEALPVGEINQYDFTDASTQIAGWWNGKTGREEGLYLPKQRTLIYAGGNDRNQ